MSAKTRRIIYIIIAAAVVIAGVLVMLTRQGGTATASAQEKIDLGNVYLTELSYDKAVIQFTEAIEIDPANAEAYIGLAKAYEGLGDTDKALEILEKGYDLTGDERILELINQLQATEETAAVTEEVTTVTTVTTAEPAQETITIKGKQYSVSLTKLDLSDSELTDEDIKPLEKMVNLTLLNLSGNQITDITPLQNLTNLEYLELLYNQVGDISALENLTKLKELHLMENQISDISALQNLAKLETLALQRNQISDITPLQNLTRLRNLYLSTNQISDVSALQNLAKLETLDLSNNQVSDSDIEALKSALPNCNVRNVTY